MTLVYKKIYFFIILIIFFTCNTIIFAEERMTPLSVIAKSNDISLKIYSLERCSGLYHSLVEFAENQKDSITYFVYSTSFIKKAEEIAKENSVSYSLENGIKEGIEIGKLYVNQLKKNRRVTGDYYDDAFVEDYKFCKNIMDKILKEEELESNNGKKYQIQKMVSSEVVVEDSYCGIFPIWETSNSAVFKIDFIFGEREDFNGLFASFGGGLFKNNKNLMSISSVSFNTINTNQIYEFKNNRNWFEVDGAYNATVNKEGTLATIDFIVLFIQATVDTFTNIINRGGLTTNEDLNAITINLQGKKENEVFNFGFINNNSHDKFTNCVKEVMTKALNKIKNIN